MKACFLFLSQVAFLLVTNHGYSRGCTECDDYLNFMHDKISLEINEDLQSSFQSWFLSDRFRSEIKDNKMGFDITIPFKGIPITFGGSNETANAWETWEKNRGAASWDFSKVSKMKLISETATKDSRQTWLQCIQTICNGQTQLFRVKGQTNKEEAVYTFSYNSNILRKTIPKYESFECIGGLDCTEANQRFHGKKMKTNGQSIKFTWLNNSESEGGVILNTTEGSTSLVMVNRGGRAKEGRILYVTEKLGDIGNPDHLVKVGVYNEDRQFVGLHNVKSKNCWTGHLSLDGKWCAAVTPYTIRSAPEQTYKNFDANCIAGPCDFTQKEALISSGENVSVNIRNWSWPTTWRLHADIYKVKTIFEQKSEHFQIVDNSVNIQIPIDAYFPLVILTLENDRSYVFNPNGELPREISVNTSYNDNTYVKYVLTINK